MNLTSMTFQKTDIFTRVERCAIFSIDIETLPSEPSNCQPWFSKRRWSWTFENWQSRREARLSLSASPKGIPTRHRRGWETINAPSVVFDANERNIRLICFLFLFFYRLVLATVLLLTDSIAFDVQNVRVKRKYKVAAEGPRNLSLTCPERAHSPLRRGSREFPVASRERPESNRIVVSRTRPVFF